MSVCSADEAMRTWQTKVTPFLNPNEAFGILSAFQGIAGINCYSSGGYTQAEKRRIFFSRDDDIELENNDIDSPHHKPFDEFFYLDIRENNKDIVDENIGAIEINGNFLFDKISTLEIEDILKYKCDIIGGEVDSLVFFC